MSLPEPGGVWTCRQHLNGEGLACYSGSNARLAREFVKSLNEIDLFRPHWETLAANTYFYFLGNNFSPTVSLLKAFVSFINVALELLDTQNWERLVSLYSQLVHFSASPMR